MHYVKDVLILCCPSFQYWRVVT